MNTRLWLVFLCSQAGGAVNTRCPERVLRIIKESCVLVFLPGVFK